MVEKMCWQENEAADAHYSRGEKAERELNAGTHFVSHCCCSNRTPDHGMATL